MFLEKRVYQGSSGCIYPLPFIELLLQLGGCIHRALDKTHGYGLIYYQPVIKPAPVGLAGPWISGGIEFNWPLPMEAHVDGKRVVIDGQDEIVLRCGQASITLRRNQRPGRHSVRGLRVLEKVGDAFLFQKP
ncbi:DUF5107 domain-containing protein [Stigmatella aurantiaca]|uniref:TPR-domain containing protein n=1 Tax=Stigmatella aurantiaca (strain DW4/3-1) TaxID=378806 RepID=Q09A26_STIAD|nr:DUF5107 domain-containing protein [Stigmatella aurantiaca]ADO68917.1 TPR-domain containing protein [Stigmatella aurantiaca DW4/3-1]EAU68564.1 TPR-domain containing protein [Stigmatella aurantiaca DW4/3-1]